MEAEDPKGRIKERMEESMSDVLNVSEIFGKNVFNDAVMKDRLPKNVYKKLKRQWRTARNWIPVLRTWWHMP